MIYARFGSVALAGLTVAFGGCSSSRSPSSGGGAAGITCTSVASAADTASAKAALAGASSGSCVLLTGASYAGPLEVPAGVSLASDARGRATITGGSASAPAVSLAAGAVLSNVDVAGAAGVGVAMRAASGRLSDVKVSGAASAALAVLCQEGCADGTIEIEKSTFEKSALGIWVSGAHVSMKGGASSEHASQSLAAAVGIVAQAGAVLELEGVTVEKNQGTGIVVDGEKTRASIKASTISENAERGVWVQRVVGTIDAPAVRIEQSKLVKNKIVGLGSVEARGIIVIGGRIAETSAAPVATNLASTEQVGDGVGLFGGTIDVNIDASTTLEANARAAGVVDGSDRGIIVIGGTVLAGPSGLKIVVQNSKGADVQVPEANRSTTPQPLGISAPKLQLPPPL